MVFVPGARKAKLGILPAGHATLLDGDYFEGRRKVCGLAKKRDGAQKEKKTCFYGRGGAAALENSSPILVGGPVLAGNTAGRPGLFFFSCLPRTWDGKAAALAAQAARRRTAVRGRRTDKDDIAEGAGPKTPCAAVAQVRAIERPAPKKKR